MKQIELKSEQDVMASLSANKVRQDLKRVGRFGLRHNSPKDSRVKLAKAAAAGPLLIASGKASSKSLAKGRPDHLPKVDQAKGISYFLTDEPDHMANKWQDLIIRAERKSRQLQQAIAINGMREDGSVFVQCSILYRGEGQ